MGKTLFVVRHGKARIKQAGERDIDRPLEPAGMRQSSRIGQYLYNKSAAVDAILSSSAVRAVQTAEQIADQIKFDLNRIIFDAELYEASVRIWLSRISELNSHWKEVIIIGHNPVISYFVEYITNHHFEGMEAGSMVKIASTADNWTEMTKDNSSFEYYISPDDLPASE